MASGSNYGINQFFVRDIASFEISKKGSTAYKIQIKAFNGVPYVGLGEFFYLREGNKWLPTKKQFFMPVPVWNELRGLFDNVCKALAEDKHGEDAEPLISGINSIGMNTIPRFSSDSC